MSDLAPSPDSGATSAEVPLTRTLVLTAEQARAGRRDLLIVQRPRLVASIGFGLVVIAALALLSAQGPGPTVGQPIAGAAYGVVVLAIIVVVLWRQLAAQSAAWFRVGFPFALGLDGSRLAIQAPTALVTVAVSDLRPPRVLRSTVAIPLRQGRGHILLPLDLVGDLLPSLAAAIEAAGGQPRAVSGSSGMPVASATATSTPTEHSFVLTPELRADLNRGPLRFWLSQPALWGMAVAGAALALAAVVTRQWVTAVFGLTLVALPAWSVTRAVRANRRSLQRWPDGTLIGYRLTERGLQAMLGDTQTLLDYQAIQAVEARAGVVSVRATTGGRLMALEEHLPPDALPLLRRYAASNRRRR